MMSRPWRMCLVNIGLAMIAGSKSGSGDVVARSVTSTKQPAKKMRKLKKIRKLVELL